MMEAMNYKRYGAILILLLFIVCSHAWISTHPSLSISEFCGGSFRKRDIIPSIKHKVFPGALQVSSHGIFEDSLRNDRTRIHNENGQILL